MTGSRTSLRYQRLRSDIYEQYAAIAWKPLRQEALSHTAAVEAACALLCLSTDCDSELAGAAALLHDCARFLDNVPGKDHARLSALRAKAWLEESGSWTSEETAVIVSAIARHSRKNWLDSDFDEVLKDADLLARYGAGQSSETDPAARQRLKRILNHPLIQAASLTEEP